MKKSVLYLTAILFFSNYLFAQNSMIGDGFGGRGWYVPHNYQVGAYSAYTVCGDSNQLYAWGANFWNELGNGTYLPTDTPVKIMGMTNVKFYTTGYISAVIKKDSTAWVWGNSVSGFPVPTKVLSNVKFADGGIGHVVFVKYDSTVWGAGRNLAGELGDGAPSNLIVTTPAQMLGTSNAVRAVSVAYGFNAATFILLADSTVKITGGRNLFQAASISIPQKVEGLSKIVDIKGNALAVYALNANGEVYSYGGFAVGYEIGDSIVPTRITFPSATARIVALSSNNDGYHCLALDSNQNVYAWGANYHGQLGCGDTIDRVTPLLVATNAIDIFAGENFSYILKADNTLWATGNSGYNSPNDGSIWMNLPNVKRNTFTQIDPTIPPMNLCAPKVWGVLPIKLSNFNCTAIGNTAYLKWQSAEEINADKYIVEYSKDGSNFQSIVIINTKGANSDYKYVHQQVNGTAFYRLKMMDKDGSFTYSEIRVVKFDSEAGITIAPNPANDAIYLLTKNNTAIKTIQLISYDGRIVRSINNYNSGQQINISSCGIGAYIVKVMYNNNDVVYARFIKK